MDAVAVTGSKVGGIGFENEQIGQIQVALAGFNDGDGFLCGVSDCGRGEVDLTD